jgi:membrane-bound lytic murein transglycosylase F
MPQRSTTLSVTVALSFLALLAACQPSQEPLPDPIDRDLAQIIERDTLYAVLPYNSTSYFVYRGALLGFEYELLRQFAQDHDLELAVRLASHPDSTLPLLMTGVGDIAGGRLSPDTSETRVRFTAPLYETPPVVVQADGRRTLPDTVAAVIDEARDRLDDRPIRIDEDDLPDEIEIRARRITGPQDLEDRTVFLPGRSPYRQRLIELSDEMTGEIVVVEIDTLSAEGLIQNVALDQIDLTVSQQNLARLQEDRFDNLVIQPVIGDPLQVAWALRPNSPELLDALQTWLQSAETQQRREQLYQRYYVERRQYRERIESEYLSSETGRLSDFDHLFVAQSESLGWDWRLLASLCYQESKFQPRARSWAGAQGLLQLMPPTAREFGVTNSYDPEQNVAGGARFLQWLQNYWEDKIPDETQRLRFILASYNTGHGHVEDARRLADRAGLDDTYWPDVAFWLLQKSNPSVYQDPVVRYGYSRGIEPVTYVSVILERFDHYRQFVSDEPEAATASF